MNELCLTWSTRQTMEGCGLMYPSGTQRLAALRRLQQQRGETEKLPEVVSVKNTLGTQVTGWYLLSLKVEAASEEKPDSGYAHTLLNCRQTHSSRSWPELTRRLAAQCKGNLHDSCAKQQGCTEAHSNLRRESWWEGCSRSNRGVGGSQSLHLVLSPGKCVLTLVRTFS